MAILIDINTDYDRKPLLPRVITPSSFFEDAQEEERRGELPAPNHWIIFGYNSGYTTDTKHKMPPPCNREQQAPINFHRHSSIG
jgi:hypothetical protein